jgi:cystathionine beta-lyase
MHALTKYPSGGGDVLMGSVVTRDRALHEQLSATHMRMGFGVSGNDVELLLRSLPSLPLRYAAQDVAGRKLGQWLGEQRGVVRVLHPALAGSPGHEHWAAVTTQAAGLFSVVLDASIKAPQVDAFIDGLRLFKIGYSWGGPVSLAVPYQTAAMRSLPQAGPQGIVVRFSVGLEEVDDLIADLRQALPALQA